MRRAALVRIAIMLGAAILALGVMGRIEDSTTAQVVAIAIALVGVIVSRVVYARMLR